MRITVKENNRDRILQVVCNCCRRPLPVENGIVLEDYIHVDKAWGYFSERDGEKIAFDLCENCSLQKGFACLCIRKKHGNIYNLIKVRFGRAFIWNERTDVRFMFIGNRRYDAPSLSLADVVNDKI